MKKSTDYSDAEIAQIAEMCHETNADWCRLNGDTSQKPWNEAPEWQKVSAIAGVTFAIDNPDAPESAQHDAWSADKIADGWIFGEAKDPEAKTHPCLVPFDQLPVFQQKKDKLFRAIVKSLI